MEQIYFYVYESKFDFVRKGKINELRQTRQAELLCWEDLTGYLLLH